MVSQLNIDLTPSFEKTLNQLMKRRGFRDKSEAIRVAVEEALERASRKPETDYSSWLGLGLKLPENPNRRFRTEDELWS